MQDCGNELDTTQGGHNTGGFTLSAILCDGIPVTKSG